MAAIPKHVALRNGVQVPVIGLGTSHNGGYNHETVVYAIRECGYRLIDTAKRYGTEPLVAQAIEDAGVNRTDMFIVTKVWPGDYGYHSTLRAFEGSAKRLSTDYIDLYLLHWPECTSAAPDPAACLRGTWRAMEELYESGKCRAIGVSNFLERHLEGILSEVAPHVNQCEFHPYQNPKELRDFCSEKGIAFQGYCPLAKGAILDKPPVVEIAKRLGKTPAQVLIRWSLQSGVMTIPKSTKKARVRENMEALTNEFEIQEEDMALLDNIGNDPELKMVTAGRMRKAINSDEPDGYKLKLYDSVYPATYDTNGRR